MKEEINLGSWEELRIKIRNHLDNDDISEFFKWKEIQYTMIANVNIIEYNHLREKKVWLLWEKMIAETKLKPNSHSILSNSSTNNLHHAYSLQKLMEFTGIQLNDFGEVIEFGGGYGNMCRLFRKWGHNKNFFMYDIPELTQLQKYYLAENGITDNVIYCGGYDKIDTIENNSLFLGMWSISEVPMNEREKLLNNLCFYDCENIFLGIQANHVGMDNLTWIKNYITPKLEQLEYRCELHKIQHLNNSYYFVAIKNKKK